MITYNGYIYDFSKRETLNQGKQSLLDRIPPEVHTYIKSKFKTIDEDEYVAYENNLNATIKQQGLAKVNKATP